MRFLTFNMMLIMYWVKHDDYHANRSYPESLPPGDARFEQIAADNGQGRPVQGEQDQGISVVSHR
jgi:hypothetical protein